ncbi:MAG: hypothetical protein EP344_09590 [Bacteroidetes bacterium]|nr:MAG: hypothetical protein EP344_09590 [Bacteroidota bacterium]
MQTLVQPIISPHPEPGHNPNDALSLQQFIDLLREEEDYYPGEQHRTKRMITRLRKIFYDKWGWNKELIRGAAKIEGRYQVTIVDDAVTAMEEGREVTHSRPLPRYRDYKYKPKHRLVTYRADDRVYGDTRVGQVPEIYKKDHQEVLLPQGCYCDIAHILAGLDAYNHKQVVSPLPNFLMFLHKLFPHVDSNVDIVTWLGDIASSSGDFLFDYLNNNKQPLTPEQEQKYIDSDACGSDMLGDIDTFVIARHYEVSAEQGPRFTEILTNYYNQDDYIRHRCSAFCAAVGLKDFDGANFSNEQEWLRYYRKQLRDNTTFQAWSLTDEKLRSIWLPIVIWFNGYRDVLKLELLLEIFLKALKELIRQEQ